MASPGEGTRPLIQPWRPKIPGEATVALDADRPCPRHHEGLWAINAETGECWCECAECYADPNHICASCTDPWHDHSECATVRVERRDLWPDQALAARPWTTS